MINKKLLSMILCIVFLLTTVSVSALTFPDVESDPSVEWAKTYINEMASKNYLKGYEDGSFRPHKTITKTESLILLARMLGVDDARFADSVEYALKENEDALSKYSTQYEEEVSFLLYMGILKESELSTYLSAKNKNADLLRYEAAILLSKLLGAEEDILDNTFVSSTYADIVEIPASARAYVEYVKEAGIMQGMGNNEQGRPIFSPHTPVTRAQMAKMLYGLIDTLDLTVASGIIDSVDEFEDTITVIINGKSKMISVEKDVKLKINGQDISIADLSIGMDVTITSFAGKTKLIENNIVIEDAIIYGLVSSTKNTGDTKSVIITDADDKSVIKTYVLSEDATVRINSAIDSFNKIKSGNYVSMTIVDGLVEILEVVDKTRTVGATLISVDASKETTTLTVEDATGKIVKYDISSEGVQVSRNSLDSTLSALMAGDTLSLRLTYEKVTKISASSKNYSLAGNIAHITHSTSGTTIGIKADGKLSEYKVNKAVEIIIDSTTEGTVYDLRPGSDVNVDLQSNEIVSIKTAAMASKSQLYGIVKSINANYGLLIVEEGGVDYNVFVNSNTKIIDSISGKTLLLKSVEKDRTISVIGSNSSGVLEANVIVLQ